jgi:hypothetical protein
MDFARSPGKKRLAAGRRHPLKTVPVKPEHRPELRYLLGDVFHLQRLNMPQREIANAMRRLAKRQLEMYPEFLGKRVAFSEDCETMDVFDSVAEWAEAIEKQRGETKEAPYVAFAADENCTGYDVMGPGKENPR